MTSKGKLNLKSVINTTRSAKTTTKEISSVIHFNGGKITHHNSDKFFKKKIERSNKVEKAAFDISNHNSNRIESQSKKNFDKQTEYEATERKSDLKEKAKLTRHIKQRSEIPRPYDMNQYANAFSLSSRNQLSPHHQKMKQKFHSRTKIIDLDDEEEISMGSNHHSIHRRTLSLSKLNQDEKAASGNVMHQPSYTGHSYKIKESEECQEESDRELKESRLTIKELSGNNKELINTVNILKSYIQIQQESFNKKIKEFQRVLSAKDKTLISMKLENEAIKKENKELKLQMLKLFYNIKTYESLEQSRETQTEKLLSQLLTENEYLRYALDNVIVTTPPCILKEPVQVEKPPEEDKEKKNKGHHKRQKTHINFNSVSRVIPEHEEHDESESTSHNTDITVKTETDDLFGHTLREMSKMNKTMKICENVELDTNSSEMDHEVQPRPLTPSSKNASRKNGLHYRVASHKEHSKLEFTK